MDNLRTLKLTIGMPTAGMVHAETMLSLLYSIQTISQKCTVGIEVYKGTYLHQLRNNIVDAARNQNSDYLMFIDSDMVFEPDGIYRLLLQEKDIIGGAYNTKTIPTMTTIKILNPDGSYLDTDKFKMPESTFKCGAVATGFMLIRLDAIKDMNNPFEFSTDKNGKLIGEDVYFCQKAIAKGLEIWCDPTVKLGHLGQYLY